MRDDAVVGGSGDAARQPEGTGPAPTGIAPPAPAPSDAGGVVPRGADPPVPPTTRRTLGTEVVLVFALSLGASGLFSLIRLLGDLTAPQRLRQQQAVLNSTLAPGRPWVDLGLQLVSLGTQVVPALLAIHLLRRTGTPAAELGLDRREPARDLLRGALLALVVGGGGLGLYIGAVEAGANLTVVPTTLPDVWWRIPVLLLSALQNATLEEVLVVGYLLHRLNQLGWRPRSALLASALIRGSYHLYQGFGGFAGNVVMGLIFVTVARRWRRVTPLIVAHTLMDAVAFVGYVLLAGKVSWLPTP